jgi:hypothetical protein
MAVAVDSGEAFRHRVAAELFQGRYYYAAEAAAPDVYDIAPDGQRFLMIREAGTAVRHDIACRTGSRSSSGSCRCSEHGHAGRLEAAISRQQNRPTTGA